MGEVVDLPVSTVLPISPERVLSGALASDLTDVLVIGWHRDGQLYLASSDAELGENLVLVELAKHEILLRAIAGAEGS